MRYLQLLIIALVLLVMLISCAGIRFRQYNDTLYKRMHLLLGHTRQEIALEMGPPTSKMDLEGMQIWSYYTQVGRTGAGVVYAASPVLSGQYKTWEQYDLIRVYFIGNEMVKWDSDVVR